MRYEDVCSNIIPILQGCVNPIVSPWFCKTSKLPFITLETKMRNSGSPKICIVKYALRPTYDPWFSTSFKSCYTRLRFLLSSTSTESFCCFWNTKLFCANQQAFSNLPGPCLHPIWKILFDKLSLRARPHSLPSESSSIYLVAFKDHSNFEPITFWAPR